MDVKRFDQFTKTLSAAGTRRGVLGFLSTLPLLGGLFSLLDEEDAEGKGRRKRRKKRHKHGKGRHKHKKHKKKCKAHSHAKTCAGKCGQVKNNCQKRVNCGPCTCEPPCGTCETCTSALVCAPCDLCCDEVCCPQATAVCHAETGACCVPDSTAQTCGEQCGEVVDNCGIPVNCGACTCGGGCPECEVCDATTNACVADQSQEGDACGEAGQVCQANGSCACSTDPDTCPACTTCGGDGLCTGCSGCCDGDTCVTDCGDCRICEDGQCAGCPDCCDTNGVCQDGTTNAACGSSGACDVCTGQEECQNQTCVCVPDCDGKVCGSDGCTDTCAPGCPPLSTCASDGTSCPCDFETCDSTCCADGENCCGNDCVDLLTDPTHCGSCGTTCAATEICDAGSCQSCDVCPTCTQTTVQAAINAASSGDTIRICAGAYTRSGTSPVASIVNKNLTLIGAGAGNGGTILDGGGVFTSLAVLRCWQTTTDLRQLTITGANGSSGVEISSPATVTLADVTVTGNTTGTGGGIRNVGALTLNAGTSITGNSVGTRGGGIFNDGGSLTLNDGSSVIDNFAPDGGGIFNDGGTVTLNAGSLVCDNAEPQCPGFTPPSGFCGACP